MRADAAVLGALAALISGSVVACAEEPAPLGEALLVVNTDASIPKRVDRLRVDVYADDGTVLQTRELDVSDAREWPVSFSVVADREEQRFVTVRLRAFLAGHVTTRAELAAALAKKSEAPVVHASLAEACAAAPTLRLGEPVTLRRGSRAITTVLPIQAADGSTACTLATQAGSVAAKLVIEDTDSYRVEVTSSIPNGARGEPGGDTTLALRADCMLPTTQLACNDDVTPATRLSAVTATLSPGTYWVVTGGYDPAPADLTLLATRVDSAVSVEPPPAPVEDPAALEPSPGATIDRLVRLRLEPGTRGTLRVNLMAECIGTAADTTNSQTCIDQAGVRVPVDTLLTRGRLSRDSEAPPPWSGEAQVPCTQAPRPPSPQLDGEVCVPGGALLLGNTLGLSDREFRAQPERLRVVAPFLMDVHEVSVGRFRDAIRRGLVPLGNVIANNGPLRDVPAGMCTWSQGASPTEPAAGVDREAYPLNCVPWDQARAVCMFFGGDLPTEDQWEHAATSAGRAFETQYPWGDERPDCARTIIERAKLPPNGCAPAFGPTAVDDASWAAKDVSPQGVVGLGGNVMEWLATGFYPYAHRAWQEAGLRAPLPTWADTEAPLRATRGGDWAQGVLFATGSARRGSPVIARFTNLGFRCARPGR